ncbi:hypothetical protein RHS01_02522 [Rhizoctonia solani]|uniref:Uncharacterized protein n=1 Tax=Rhizoctonia solani TaxID=456999 RepID=A0A8H7IIM1_9AGAM|nr:hypothetical protein RHS01_02522 [Rhizoctonia solani]
MALRATSILFQCGTRGMATKVSKHPSNFKPQSLPALELASLPPAESIRSLQRLRAKRGTIRPILNYEPIKRGARVDPVHPAATWDEKSLPYSSHELGVVIQPTGGLKPLPPRNEISPFLNWGRSGEAQAQAERSRPTSIHTRSRRGPSDWQNNIQKILKIWSPSGYFENSHLSCTWTSVIKAVRNSLLVILKKGREMDMQWNLEIADREAKAMADLAPEMRRIRMWRRQDHEAALRGRLSEDVGIRWKLKGMGPKNNQSPSRTAFQHGNGSDASPKFSAPIMAPITLNSKNSSKLTAASQSPYTALTRPKVEIAQAAEAQTRQTRPGIKRPDETSGPILMKPPSESLVGNLRRKPQSKHTSGSALKSQNGAQSSGKGDLHVSSNSKSRP